VSAKECICEGAQGHVEVCVSAGFAAFKYYNRSGRPANGQLHPFHSGAVKGLTQILPITENCQQIRTVCVYVLQ
jgi:hypothetical protein